MVLDFHRGTILRIDLSTASTRTEPLNMEWARLYLGGKGLLYRYLFEEVRPGLDPAFPDNPRLSVTGPFAGTSVSTSSRLVVGCKSPATGTILDSYVGGSFAPETKFAGYDIILLTGKADWVINSPVGGQNFFALKFSGIWCDFWAITLEQIGQLMKHIWGRKVSPEELMRLGERIWNLGRLFNLREGFTAADDALPSRIHDRAFAEGPAAGRVISREEFATSLAEYYRLRGWNENGVPTEEKLQEFEIDVRL